MTSACVHGVASAARSPPRTTEHVPRPHTGAHTDGDRHACRMGNSSLLAFLRHNKQEGDRQAAAETPLSISNRSERSGEEEEEEEQRLATTGARNTPERSQTHPHVQ